MKTPLLLIGIFCAELAWSWLTDMSLVSVVGRKPWEADTCNVLGQMLAYEVLRVIAKKQWNRLYIYVAIFGSTVGTILVSLRG